jgi:CRP/FNR family transcriptional regulator, cyclic AMP receptor protein
MKTIANELADHPFFATLAPEHRELLAGCGRNVVVPARSSLIREGANADVFWALRSGRVALGVIAPGQGMQIIETLHAGDVLGWAWLFPPYHWHFDADALDEVHAIVFDATCLRTKCNTDPVLGFDLAQRFAGILSERLHATRMRLLDLYGISRSG